jgi:hypothetical protein
VWDQFKLFFIPSEINFTLEMINWSKKEFSILMIQNNQIICSFLSILGQLFFTTPFRFGDSIFLSRTCLLAKIYLKILKYFFFSFFINFFLSIIFAHIKNSMSKRFFSFSYVNLCFLGSLTLLYFHFVARSLLPKYFY